MYKLQDTRINIRLSLTWGIRSIIYSNLPLMDLVNTISKLNKQERRLVANKELVNQKKNLQIKNDSTKNVNIYN